MIRLALYLAFGMLFHVIFIGSQFEASNLWSWLWLLGWPIALLVTFGLAMVVLSSIAIASVYIWERIR